MRIFFDWEFIDRGAGIPLEPVSLAMVREDGVYTYVINEGCLANVVKHPWLSLNVVPHLPIKFDNSNIFFWDPNHADYTRLMSVDGMAAEALRFIREAAKVDGEVVELWADYAAYDHVVLAQLFGPMNELPAGIPKYTNDLQQELARLRRAGIQVELPPTPEHNHHAVADALWALDAFKAIMASQGQGALVAKPGIVDAVVVELEPEPEQPPIKPVEAIINVAGDGGVVSDVYGHRW